MSSEEFSNEFDILYNNILSNSALGVNDYEKSVFLTKAQDEVLNILSDQFEVSEEIREYLKPLLRNNTITTQTYITGQLSANSVCFNLPTDIFRIIYEAALLTGSVEHVEVKSISYNDFIYIKNNPFKGPTSTRVLKIDYYNATSSTDMVELIVTVPIDGYLLRYIKKPYPIIVGDLTEFGATIDGQTTAFSSTSASELPDILHRKIIEAGVLIAKKAYEEISNK